MFSAPVVCAFGMTEATHQVCTTGIDSDENPAATTGLVGRSTGPEIRIVGSDGQPLPPGAVGEVWLHGPTVVRGYLGDPAITAANFTEGWLRTGDLGSLSAAGDLSIRGRIKELINRGGEKISPERVEGVLASHPDVLEVAVFGVPDKMYGETVAAVIVPRGSAAPTPAELAEFCRERLAAFEVPASFREASALPHTAKGSLDRRAVAEQFGGVTSVSSTVPSATRSPRGARTRIADAVGLHQRGHRGGDDQHPDHRVQADFHRASACLANVDGGQQNDGGHQRRHHVDQGFAEFRVTRTGGDAPTFPSSHAPELVVNGVRISVPTDSTRTSQISRRRAAGHSAQRIARIAVSGPRTTTKWLSRICAGRPLTVVTMQDSR